MHYLLTYHYSADYLQRRGEFRNGHLAGAWAAQGRGELVLGGTTRRTVPCSCLTAPTPA